MRKAVLPVLLAVLAAGLLSAERSSAGPDAPNVVVTTTLIECGVRDLVGNDVDIVRLLPAGSCPGHFDLEPQQVEAMASAALFVRHDYQSGLDAGAARSGMDTGRVVAVTSLPAFTIPGSYAALCAELKAALARAWPEREPALRRRLRDIEDKAAEVERDIRRRTAHLRGHRVLCARYQKDFCEWIGLEVVAAFDAGADESAWQLNRVVDMAGTAGAEAVVGNRQWGWKHLDALGEATGRPGVMLSNFPERGDAGAYWALVEDNVSALLETFRDSRD